MSFESKIASPFDSLFKESKEFGWKPDDRIMAKWKSSSSHPRDAEYAELYDETLGAIYDHGAPITMQELFGKLKGSVSQHNRKLTIWGLRRRMTKMQGKGMVAIVTMVRSKSERVNPKTGKIVSYHSSTPAWGIMPTDE